MKFTMGMVSVPASAPPPSGSFIGESHSVTGASTTRVLALPSGTQAGDLLIVMVQNAFVAPTLPGGYTSVGSGAWPAYAYLWAIGYKVLVAGDITTGTVTMTNVETNAPMFALTYRGPTVATLINNNNSAAAADAFLDQAGFTKAGGCDAIVSIAIDRDPSGTPTPPTGMASRVSTYYSAFFAVSYADFTTPADYTDGATLTWTTFTAVLYQHGWLIELT